MDTFGGPRERTPEMEPELPKKELSKQVETKPPKNRPPTNSVETYPRPEVSEVESRHPTPTRNADDKDIINSKRNEE